MTNLTEYSWYYCKMKDGDIQMLEYGADYFLSGDVPLLNNEVESVLAEVPSFELWKAVHEQWKVLLEENTKLKELLKRIRKELNDCPTCVEGSWKAELVDKIDQILANNQIQANTVACNKIQENK